VAEFADGAVVGSALVNLMESHPDADEVMLEVSDYIRALKEAGTRKQ
jgi:tryptophan synthase alpha subunit